MAWTVYYNNMAFGQYSAGDFPRRGRCPFSDGCGDRLYVPGLGAENCDLCSEVLQQEVDEKACDLKNNIKENLKEYLYQRTKRDPMILPIILEV